MTPRAWLNGLERKQQLVWLVLIWLLLLTTLWIWWDERTLPDIRGEWVSAGCEEIRSQDGVSYVKRRMLVGETDWNLHIEFYHDAACEQGSFGLDISGPYDLGPKSMEIRDATTARFDLSRTMLTPLSPDFAARFAAARCGDGVWTVGDPQDVTGLGCLGLVPTSDSCPVEYDIVKIEDDKLHLGDRSRGLCDAERYPERFSSSPLRRIDTER